MRKLKERTIQVETNELDDAKETHEVHTDPATGKRYSIDKNTGESTWVVQNHTDEKAVKHTGTCSSTFNEPTIVMEEKALKVHKVHTDPATGK